MIDEKTMQILSHLRLDARKNLSTIGRELGVPVSTIHDRVKRFEQDKIRFTTLVDFNKVGFSSVYLALSCAPYHKDNLKKFLINNQNINSMYSLNSGFDFLVEVIFRDIKERENLINSLKQFELRQVEEFVTCESVKKESFMMASPSQI